MMRRIFLSVFLSSLLVVFVGGCRDNGSGNVVASRPAVCEPDDEFETDEIKGEFFDGRNCFTAETVARLRESRSVSAELDRFADRGYVLARQHAFVARGISAGGEQVTITGLPLEGADRIDHAVYLYCIETGGKLRVVPVALDLPAEGDTGTRGVGLEPIEPLDDSPLVAGVTAFPSWRYWVGCLAEAFASRSLMCWATCRFVAVSYVQCMIVCESAAAVAAVLACTFRVFAGGTD